MTVSAFAGRVGRRTGLLLVAAAGGAVWAVNTDSEQRRNFRWKVPKDGDLRLENLVKDFTPPSRDEIVARLKTGRADKGCREFDILVIGGGATGTGIALDAATRGLNVALVERDDFGSGTSSKSTKMLHGGVRYLEKAITGFDLAQLSLVTEALHERSTVIKIAPFLCWEWDRSAGCRFSHACDSNR